MNRRRHTARRTRAMLSRSRKRAANTQVAMIAEIMNEAAIATLSITVGTALDGRLVMSKTDWQRAIAAGAVSITQPSSAP